MSVLLSHNSALEVLRAVPPQTGMLKALEEPFDMKAAASGVRCVRDALSSCEALRQRPAHVLVGPSCTRGARGEVRAHQTRCASIPDGFLRRVQDGLLCCGPELVFLQMANETSLVGAAVLGFELCGGYAHFSQLASGFYDRPPLTSREKIGDALGKLAGVRGKRRAAEALDLVLDGSRSPMETVLTCALAFPGELGGCGFEAPIMNHEVVLDGRASALAGLSRCCLDLAWPEQMRAFEYDGAAWHTDARADRRRREALASMGWTVNVIDLADVSSGSSLMGAISLIEGVVPRAGDGPIDAATLQALLGRLLKATRFGLGLNAALFGVPVGRGVVDVHV